MVDKVYSETEVSALLGRASRIQAAKISAGQTGLTLEEIKAAAAEAGIDPRCVELASTESSDHSQTYWSIPTGVGHSVTVSGSLTEDQWGRMVAVFSRDLGGLGQTDVQNTTRAWSRGSLRVTVDHIGNQTMLHAETEWGKELELPIALAVVGSILAATMGAVALVSQEWSFGVLALLEAILVIGVFSMYRNRQAAKQERFRNTFEATLEQCATILLDDTPVAGQTRQLEPDHPSKRVILSDLESIENPESAKPDSDVVQSKSSGSRNRSN